MKRIATTLLWSGLLLGGPILPALAQTTTTSWQGGSGDTVNTLNCSSGQRLVGIWVRHGIVIDQIGSRCATPTANGGWQGNPMHGGFAPSGVGGSGTAVDVLCPSDHFVTGFRVNGRNHAPAGLVLARVEVTCQRANTQLNRIGGTTTRSGGGSASGGIWLPPIPVMCPDNRPIADGLHAGTGMFVGRIRLRCRVANPDLQPGAFNLISPTNNHAILFDQSFSWQAASNASNYTLLAYPDPPSQGSPPWTNNVTQRYPAGGATSLGFNSTMVNNLQGRKIAWTVEACSSTNTCRLASGFRYAFVPLLNANQSSPAANASVPNRRPSFSWQQRAGAQRYKVVLQPNSNSPVSQQVMITSFQGVTGTSFTPSQDLPASLGNSPVWFVRACKDFPGGLTDVCSGPFTASDYRVVNLGSSAGPAVTFTPHIAPTFKHPRCTTCHAVAATGFRRVNDRNPGVLPAAHPVVNAQTNCVSCHTNALLPSQGSINPGFQSAPANMDFRNKSDQVLCNMAKQHVSGHSPLQHMTQDKLILWAVGDGRVPGKTLPTAPPNNIASWQSLITQWVDAGMPCQ